MNVPLFFFDKYQSKFNFKTLYFSKKKNLSQNFEKTFFEVAFCFSEKQKLCWIAQKVTKTCHKPKFEIMNHFRKKTFFKNLRNAILFFEKKKTYART